VELIEITPSCFYFSNPTNLGYVRKGDTGLLIDAGLDASIANKALRLLDERGWPLTHVFITHAHADHYGGLHQIQKKRAVMTAAPAVEADVLRYPKWEALYLFQGNEPPQAMRNKFIEGKAASIDVVCGEGRHRFGDLDVKLIPLPGHADHQMGVLVDGVLYAADSYVSLDYLFKHKIPFFTDLDKLLASQEKLLSLADDLLGAVPSHGVFEKEFKNTVWGNIAFHNKMLDEILALVERESLPAGIDRLVKTVCDACEVELSDVAMWGLYRTAVVGYLMAAVRRGHLEMAIEENVLVFKKA